MTVGIRVRTLEELLADNIRQKDIILEPWLEERHLCMIHAPTGLGKSFLSLSIGLAVAGGGSVLGWKCPIPKKVMLIDGEMDIEDIQTRCKLMMHTVAGDHEAASKNFTIMARQDQEIDVKFPDLASVDGQDIAIRHISEINPDLIILDNFSTLCEVENENDAASFTPIIRFLSSLKQGRKAVVLVHHSRKGAGGLGSYRGSTKLAAPFNSIISLSAPKFPENLGVHFELRWEKFRGLRVESMSDLTVKLSDGKWSHEQLQADNASRLVHLVKTLEHPDQASLGEKLGISQSAVSKLKAQAVASGLISEYEYNQCLRQAKCIRDEASDEGVYQEIEPEF